MQRVPHHETLRPDGLLESALYVADLERSTTFYTRVLGLERIAGDGRRFAGLSAGPRQLLLLFTQGGATEPLETPGGVIPPHDGSGHLHVAFAIASEAVPRWERHLAEHGIEIASRIRWPRGGTSLYVHDPDGHVVELATPGLWPTY